MVNPVVLLVEDNENYLNVYSQILRSGLCDGVRCEVICAVDGVDGFEKFSQNINDISFVITDFKMPRLNGGELAKKIRDLDPTMHIILNSSTFAPPSRSHLFFASTLKDKENFISATSMLIQMWQTKSTFFSDCAQISRQATCDLNSNNKTSNPKISDKFFSNIRRLLVTNR